MAGPVLFGGPAAVIGSRCSLRHSDYILWSYGGCHCIRLGVCRGKAAEQEVE